MNIVLSTIKTFELRIDEKNQLEQIENLSRTNKNRIRKFVNQNKWLRAEVKMFMSINHLANPYEYSIVIIAKNIYEKSLLMNVLDHGYLDEDEVESIDSEKIKKLFEFIQLDHSWLEPILRYYVKVLYTHEENVKLLELIVQMKKKLNSIKLQLRTDNFGRFINLLNDFFQFDNIKCTPINPIILNELIRNLRFLSASNENHAIDMNYVEFFDGSSDDESNAFESNGVKWMNSTQLSESSRAGNRLRKTTETPNQSSNYS